MTIATRGVFYFLKYTSCFFAIDIKKEMSSDISSSVVPEGFEPPLREPKPPVLPLYYGTIPIFAKKIDNSSLSTLLSRKDSNPD